MTALKPTSFLLCLFACASFLTGCEDDPATDQANAPYLEIRLTDAPGDYEKVLIDVVDIQVRYSDGEWIDLDRDYPATYDLLELNSGIDTLLATSDLPVGELEEVRLILGENNFLQLEGETELIELNTPSAQQSGLKVKLDDADLLPDGRYALVLDFDAGRSIVRAGNSGRYNLKPVIRGTFRELDADSGLGVLQGQVLPADRYYVYAYQTGGDTVSTYSLFTGFFKLTDVPAGNYEVVIESTTNSGLNDKLISNNIVRGNETTNLGDINFGQ